MTLGSLARGSAIYTIAGILPRLASFLMLPLYVHFLSRAEFGTISLVSSIAILAAIVYRLGLDTALTRLHFDPGGATRGQLYASLLAATAVVSLVFSLVLGLVLAPFFDDIFVGLAFVPFGLLALGLTVTSALQYPAPILFRSEQQPGRFLALNGVTLLIGTALVLVAVVVLRLGAVGALLGQLLGACIAVVIGLVIVMRLRPLGFHMGVVRSALRFGLPLVPHSLAGWVLNVSDRWLIGLLIGLPAGLALQQIAVYSFGYQLGHGVMLIGNAFNTAWAPAFFRRGEHPDGPRLLREMTTVWIAAMAGVAVAVSAFAPELIGLIAPEGYEPAADVIAIVACASAVHSVYLMVVGALFLRWRTAILPVITAVAGVLTVVLNVVLIPSVGIVGAAWATLGGYTVLAVGTYLYARRIYPLRLDLVRLGAFAVLAAAAVLAARALPEIARGWPPVVLHGLAVVLFGGLALLLVLGPLRAMRTLAASTASADMPAESADAAGRSGREAPTG